MSRSPALASLLAGVAALAVVPSVGLSQAPEGAAARLAGTWRLALPRDQAIQRRDAAVEQVVNAMSFFIRSIARDRLREGSPVDERITLAFEDGEAEVRFGSRATYRTRVGQTQRRARPDGESLRVTQRFGEGGRLEQVFQSDGGTRWFVYRPTGEGRLRLEITTNSDRLPQPVRYVLPYRR